MRTIILGVVLALGLCSATAHAQTTQQLSPEQRAALDDEARQLFEAGDVAYQNGRFDRAYEYFSQSYELSNRALILYNMGLSAELARRDEDALAAYRGYLAAVPDSEVHARVRTRVEVLEARVESGEASGDADPPAASADGGGASASTGGGGSDGLGGWLLFGGGLAVAITGGALLGVAASDVDRVENAPQDAPWSDYEESASRAEPLSIAGGVLLGVGAAAAALGIVLAVTSGGSDESVALRVGPTSLAVTGSFR